MAFKFVLLAAIVAVSQAVVLPNGQVLTAGLAGHYGIAGPVVTKVASPVIAKVATDDYDPNPQYSYSYDVNDAITGDSKSQQETRSGDVVQGSYSLVEPDGTRRTVEYTADPIQGFNAVVHREPLVQKVIAAPGIAKIASPLVASHGLVHGGIVSSGLVHGGLVQPGLVHGGLVSSSVLGPRIISSPYLGQRVIAQQHLIH